MIVELTFFFLKVWSVIDVEFLVKQKRGQIISKGAGLLDGNMKLPQNLTEGHSTAVSLSHKAECQLATPANEAYPHSSENGAPCMDEP